MEVLSQLIVLLIRVGLLTKPNKAIDFRWISSGNYDLAKLLLTVNINARYYFIAKRRSINSIS